MPTPRRQISLFKVFLADDILARLQTTFQTGYIGQGQKVAEFEMTLQRYLGHSRFVSTNSGTSALHLALHLLRAPSVNGSNQGDPWPGLKDGDEVLTTPFTCVATNWPILANRLRIRWLDIRKEDLNVDARSIAAKLSPRTKLVMVVHWGGYPVDLEQIGRALSDAETEFGFRPVVIEDCAHALGSMYAGRMIGTHGNLCAFSFQAVKSLTCGDGGALCLPTDELTLRARRARWYGIDREDPAISSFHERDVSEWGFKFHMNDINATIGLANFPHLEWILERQRQHAAFYDSALRSVPGISLLSYDSRHRSSYYLYPIRVERRLDFQRWLQDCGIEAGRVHSRNDWHRCVSHFRENLPTLDDVYEGIVCLPVGWWLESDDLGYVTDCISKGW